MYAKERKPFDLGDLFQGYNKVEAEKQQIIKRIAEFVYDNTPRPTTLEALPNEIEKYLQELSTVNWEEVLSGIHQIRVKQQEESRALYEAHYSRIVHCGHCHKEMTQRDVYTESMAGVRLPGDHPAYCQECFYKVQSQYKRICCLCGSDFLAARLQDNVPLCQQCHTRRTARAYRLICSHNQRASSLGLVANLTLPQWLETLSFFQEQCAYCRSPFKILEHYLPISAGGGTTQANCLPGCSSCNRTKKDKLPEQFERLFPTENIQRIKGYIASLKRAENRHGEQLAALFGIE